MAYLTGKIRHLRVIPFIAEHKEDKKCQNGDRLLPDTSIGD